MSGLFAWLERVATPRRVVVLLLLEVLLIGGENLLFFPLSVPYLRRLTGHDYLDTCAFCGAPRLYAELSGLGETGRHLQLRFLSTIDLAIPSVSGLFGATALMLLSKPLRSKRPTYRWLALVPLAASCSDFSENLGVALLASSYPRRLTGVAVVVGLLTGIKFVAYGATVLVLLGLGAWRLAAGPRSSNA
ncbi:MAG TPA: hypothetical protein VGQ57_01220 [Polyangiaceae bacterium]|jgi:hypothetical protein|nr:hypothetical protein [Polyangiaceae bacterium]